MSLTRKTLYYSSYTYLGRGFVNRLFSRHFHFYQTQLTRATIEGAPLFFSNTNPQFRLKTCPS